MPDFSTKQFLGSKTFSKMSRTLQSHKDRKKPMKLNRILSLIKKKVFNFFSGAPTIQSKTQFDTFKFPK